MLRTLITAAAIAATTLTAITPTAVLAHDHGDRGGWHQRGDNDDGDDRYQGREWNDRGRYERQGFYREGYRDHGYYRGDDRYYGRRDGGYNDRGHGYRQPVRYRCRDDGTGGLIIGAIAGGLLGNEIARDGTAGTIIGGGIGALAGRAIDQSGSRC